MIKIEESQLPNQEIAVAQQRDTATVAESHISL